MESNKRQVVAKDSNPFFKYRFIASTEADLDYLSREGKFRQDLYYRLNVIPLTMPPLRNRKEDISLLADFFMMKACQELNKCFVIPSDELKRQFYIHNWPGNVDELQRLIYRVVVAGDESIVQSKSFLPENTYNNATYLMQDMPI